MKEPMKETATEQLKRLKDKLNKLNELSATFSVATSELDECDGLDCFDYVSAKLGDAADRVDENVRELENEIEDLENKPRIIRCVVACMHRNRPCLIYVNVNATAHDIEKGRVRKAAALHAELGGNESPMVVFTEEDSSCEVLFDNTDWIAVSTVEAAEKQITKTEPVTI